MLLSASSARERKIPVYLVIDEFQRMATRNLDYLLQQARSLGVSVVLANQSIQDLRRYDLVNVLETNCRYKQWFAISSWEDQHRLVQASGETVDEPIGQTTSESLTPKGTTTGNSVSRRETVVPRLSQNDVKLASDEDRKSIVLINRGEGYAQFGGMPLTVETDYHISKSEYERRKNSPWPTEQYGTFVPKRWERPAMTIPHRGRKAQETKITQETIDFESESTRNANHEETRDSAPAKRGPHKKAPSPKQNQNRKNKPGPVRRESSTESALKALLQRDPILGEREGEGQV